MKKLLVKVTMLCMCSFLMTGCGLLDATGVFGALVNEADEEESYGQESPFGNNSGHGGMIVTEPEVPELPEINIPEPEITISTESGTTEINVELPELQIPDSNVTSNGIQATAEDGDDLYDEACEDYMAGDFENAIAKLKQAEVNGVSYYALEEVYNLMGNCYVQMDDYEDAFVVYKKALELQPNDVTYIVNLAVAYRQYGNNEKAKELYEQALLIDPDYPELNSSLGSLYVLEGEPELAITYFEKALEADPTLGVTYGNCALAYAMTGNFEKADLYVNMSVIYGYENADIIKEMIEELR